jgi:hypothetical protein
VIFRPTLRSLLVGRLLDSGSQVVTAKFLFEFAPEKCYSLVWFWMRHPMAILRESYLTSRDNRLGMLWGCAHGRGHFEALSCNQSTMNSFGHFAPLSSQFGGTKSCRIQIVARDSH